MNHHSHHPSRRRSQTVLLCSLLVSLIAVSAARSDEPSGRARFVPADQLADVFDKTPQGVFLPREEYLALVSKASAAKRASANSPEPVVIESASYKVSQNDNHAIVELTINVRQFLDDWAIARFPLGNLSLESATIDNRAAHVARVDGTDHIAIAHNGAGTFAIKLELSTPLGVVGSDRVAAFRTSGDIPTTLSVNCPAGKILNFNDLKIRRPADITERTDYTIPAGSFDQVRLKWTTERQQSDSQSLVFAKTNARLSLSADNLRWNSDSRLSVFGSAINQIMASVPAELEITAVDSAGLESWKLEDDPDSAGDTRLVLSYRQPFTQDRMLKISAVMTAVGSEQWQVPNLQFRQLTSHTGRLLVQHQDNLRLLADAQNGIRQVSLGQAQGEAFDFWLQDFDLGLTVRPRDRELFAEVNSWLRFDDSQVTLEARTTIESLNAPLFELPVTVPSGWQVAELTGLNNPAPSYRKTSDESVIVLQPQTPVAAGGLLGFRLVLTRTIDSPTQEQVIDIPIVSASNALLVGGTYSIAGATDLTVSPLQINGLAPIADENGQTLFETQGTSYSGRVSVVRKPSRLASRAVIRTWLDERQKSVELLLTVDVLNGTTRTLDLAVPESLGSDLRFSLQSITQVPGHSDQMIPGSLKLTEQSADEPVDGQRVYRLTFDRRFVGAVTLRTFVQQEREADTKLAAPFIKVEGAVRQHGLIAFEAQSDQQIDTPQDLTGSGLSIADAGLIPAPPASTGRRVALVYRFIQPDYQLELTETTFATNAVPSAVVPLIENTSVVSEGEMQQRQSRIHFRCSGVQTMRFVLPHAEQSYLWSTVLNGEPIEVRKDESDYLVAIPPGSPATDYVLEVLFESPSVSSSFLGESAQDSVQLKIDTEDGRVTPVDVLQQQWDVRYPPSAMLLNHGAGFRPLRAVDQAGWLQTLPDLLSLPTRSTFLERARPAVVLLAIFFVATALIVKRRWKTLAAVAIFAFVLTLPRVFNSRQYQAEKSIAPASPSEETAEYEEDYGMMSGGRNLQELAPSDTAGGMAGFGGIAGAEMAPMEGMDVDGEMDFARNAAGLERSTATPQRASGGGDADGGDGFAGDSTANGSGGSASQMSAPRDDFSGQMAGLPAPDFQMRKGAARLSVKASIAAPGDFRSMQFRSIGATADAGRLQITIQPRARVTALRIIAAAFVALVCLLINRAPAVSKVAFLVIITIAAIAAVPVAPNEWQSAVDGVLIGAGLGLVIWLAFAVCGCLMSCCRGLFRPKNMTLGTTAKLLLLALLCGGSTVVAQPPTETAASEDIILPYDPDQPELLADKVFLPQSQFLKLYRAAYPDRLKTETLPLPGQVIAAYYTSTDLNQVAGSTWTQTIKARFVIQIASEAQPTVDIPLGSVAIKSAVIDGQPVAMTPRKVPAAGQSDAGQMPQQTQQRLQTQAKTQQVQSAKIAAPGPAASAYQVSVTTPGLHLLDVEFDVAADVEGAVGKLSLPLRSAGMGTLTFTLPADDLDATINGRTSAYRRDGRTLILPTGQAKDITIAWRPAEKKNAADTTYHSYVNSALSISDQGLTLESALRISCRQGELSELDIVLPTDYSVRSVDGTEIAGWETPADSPGSLRLLFKQPVTKEAIIRLTLFRRAVFGQDESRLNVPVPVVPGSTRDVGMISVCAGSELEVRVDSLSAVSQINAADVPAPDGTQQNLPRILAWRYTRHPVSIGVRVFRDADRLNINTLSGVQLEAQRQLWTTLVSANISGAPRRRIEVEVPDDFLALDVTANGLADWYYTDGTKPGTRLLNIQLQQARSGVVNAVIQGQTGRAQNELTAQLKPLIVRGATSVKATISVWLDAASEIASVNSGEWNRVGREVSLDPRILKLQSDSPDISFQTTAATESDIALELRQAESSLAAESVTISTVTDTSVELTLGLNWKISGAATRTVAFQIPAALSDVYDFQVPGLRRLQKSTEGDVTTVTVHLQQPAGESLFVLGIGTLPLPDSREISPEQPEFVVPETTSDRVSTQSHFWVIVNQSPGLLQPVDAGQDGDQVKPDEIRTNMPPELLEQAVAIRRLKSNQPQTPWLLSFPERQQVAPAIVALAAHTTVIAEDGTWRSRHRLQVRNESRQFLTVQMPDDSRLLYSRVEGRPVRMVSRTLGEQELFLIPIPQSGEVSRPINVEFAIAGTTALRNLRAAGSDLSIPCPHIPTFREFPEFGVTISRNTWQVYVPQSWHTSVLDNPRQTNMARANQEVLEDTIMLSGMENLKSILNAASSQGQVDNINLVQEIERQSLLLESLRCNDISVAQQRTEILNEAEVLFEQLNRDNKDQIDAIQQWQSEGAGVNSFLDQQALQQNGYNQRNSLNLLFGNSAQGVQVDIEEPALFNFVLPTEPQSESRSGREFGGKRENGKAAPKVMAPVDNNASQLLNRRDSNRKSQSEQLKLQNMPRKAGQLQAPQSNSVPAFGSRQLMFPGQPLADEDATLIIGGNATGGVGQNGITILSDGGVVSPLVQPEYAAPANQSAAPADDPFSTLQAGEVAVGQVPQSGRIAGNADGWWTGVAGTGLLSLEFDIPEDGLRYDFVRSGGNASLALRVQPQDSVNRLQGLIWIVVCLILLIIILQGASHGMASLARRVCLILSVASLAGWMCTQNPVRDLAIGVFVVAALLTCILYIVQSRAQSRPPVEA
ncbi:MAG: hypothetical protein NXI04_05960 [Planctomycetaceae bacterium]|nr:hypothetical protein [Planctomycetaceae bacterium]